jgi:uncharacterized membrane protein YphA (DoxX/SURF4 family)
MDKNKVGLTLLRFGFVFVFVWFASQQILHTGMWTGLIPKWILSMTGVSAMSFVFINAAFEAVGAILLALNLWTPIVALLLSLHVFTIAYDLGLNAIGVRDIGLAVSLLSLALLSCKRNA